MENQFSGAHFHETDFSASDRRMAKAYTRLAKARHWSKHDNDIVVLENAIVERKIPGIFHTQNSWEPLIFV